MMLTTPMIATSSHSCFGGLGKERIGDAEDAVAAHLQQDGGQDHADRRRGFDVRIGQPRVERHGRHLDQEADHQQDEERLGDRRASASIAPSMPA